LGERCLAEIDVVREVRVVDVELGARIVILGFGDYVTGESQEAYELHEDVVGQRVCFIEHQARCVHLLALEFTNELALATK